MPQLIGFILLLLAFIWLIASILSSIVYFFVTLFFGGLTGGAALLCGYIIFVSAHSYRSATATYRIRIVGTSLEVERVIPGLHIYESWRIPLILSVAGASFLGSLVFGPLANLEQILKEYRGDGFEHSTHAIGLWLGGLLALVAAPVGGGFLAHWIMPRWLSALEEKSAGYARSRLRDESVGFMTVVGQANAIAATLADIGVNWSFRSRVHDMDSRHSSVSSLKTEIAKIVDDDRRQLEQIAEQVDRFCGAFDAVLAAYHAADEALDANPSASLRSRLDEAWLGLEPQFISRQTDQFGFEKARLILVTLESECENIARQARLGSASSDSESRTESEIGIISTRADALRLLGLPDNATMDQIKAVRNAQLFAFHHDHVGEEWTEHVQKINDAWEILRAEGEVRDAG